MCTSHPPMRKLSFATGGDHYRRQQNAELWSIVTTDTCTTQFLHLKLRDHCERGSEKHCKSKRNRKFAVKFYLLEMLEKPHPESLINMA